MTQRLPSTGARGCDTGEMKVIHRLFRQLFGDARDLTAGVADQDQERADVVGRFVLDIADGLHRHHSTEDLLLWDDLEARVPACTSHVNQMKEQHARIAQRLAVVEETVPRWTQRPDAAAREAVLTALDEVMEPLLEHLGDEEDIILPAVSTSFSQAEFDALGEHARAEIPRGQMFVQLGMILASMEPEERRRWFRHNLPLPARVAYQLIGRRQYETARARVYGTVRS